MCNFKSCIYKRRCFSIPFMSVSTAFTVFGKSTHLCLKLPYDFSFSFSLGSIPGCFAQCNSKLQQMYAYVHVFIQHRVYKLIQLVK